jgi:hypothetical protein
MIANAAATQTTIAPVGAVVMIRIRSSADAGLRCFEVIRTGDLDGDWVRLVPLAVDDHRGPFWYPAERVVVIKGARVDDNGYLIIPTNQVED